MTKQIAQPSLTDVLTDVKLDIFKTFNCHRIGRITLFNAENQTASVEFVDKGVIDTDDGRILIDFPLLTDCPVFINKGSSGGITRPIEVGEYCLIHFNDRDIDNWFVNGNIQQPNTDRKHNLTDCLVSVGFFSSANPLSNYDNQATTINYNDNIIKLSDGIITIATSEGAEVNLDDLIEIKNSAQNLKLLIDSFIDIIKALQVVDPISGNLPVDPGTQAALDTLKINFAQLLK